MRKIWAHSGPVTVRDIVGDLQHDRPIAYTTVMTVMGNLRKKRWLRRQEDGRAYRYEPTLSGEEYSAWVMRQALTASRDPAGPLMHFLGDLPAEEPDALTVA